MIEATSVTYGNERKGGKRVITVTFTTPDGQQITETRTTARTYTALLIGRSVSPESIKGRRGSVELHRSNFNHAMLSDEAFAARFPSLVDNGDPNGYAARHREERERLLAETPTFEQYLAAERVKEQEQIDRLTARGWMVLGWAGRPDLAVKAMKTWPAKGCIDHHVVVWAPQGE